MVLNVPMEAHQGCRGVIFSVRVLDRNFGCNLFVVVVKLEHGLNLANAWVAVETIDLLEAELTTFYDD